MYSKKQNSFKILAVGDLHGDSGLSKKLAKRAKDENVDLIILSGDITWIDQEFKDVIRPFEKLGKEILLIPGNHEPNSTINTLSEIYSKTKNIHEEAFRKGDLGIFGAGYDSQMGPFWVEDKEIFEALKKGHEKIKDAKKKIMVTHTTHSGGKAELLGIKGSEAVKKAIKKFKPDLVISGHVHEAGGIEEKLGKTKIINVARNAAIFEI